MKPSPQQIAAYHAALDHLEDFHAHSIDPLTRLYRKSAAKHAHLSVKSTLNKISLTWK